MADFDAIMFIGGGSTMENPPAGFKQFLAVDGSSPPRVCSRRKSVTSVRGLPVIEAHTGRPARLVAFLSIGGLEPEEAGGRIVSGNYHLHHTIRARHRFAPRQPVGEIRGCPNLIGHPRNAAPA